MENGYKVRWTSHALKELKSTFDYLESKWSSKELARLSLQIEQTVNLLAKAPDLFPKSISNNQIRKAVVAKYNTLYYRINGDEIEILSFFSNRQKP